MPSPLGRALLSCLLIPASAHGKPPIPTPVETPILGELDRLLLGTLYQDPRADLGLKDALVDPRLRALIERHGLHLFGGPMLGCVTDSSARVWVRTPGAARVRVRCDGRKSEEVTTTARNDFTALIDLDGLKPATTYRYDVLVDGVSAFDGDLAAFRTAPAKGQPAVVTAAFGGGARYNPSKEGIWDVIADHRPDALLMLGDNVYIDEPHSRTKQRVHYYRRQLRPEYRRLVASSAVYAVYDDHDLGVNDSSGGPDPFKPDWKYASWKVFRENWNNPAYGDPPERPGCWFDFSLGDVDFFMLDNRYYRDFKSGTMLGPDQKAWLFERLRASDATFKVLASGTLWTEHADKGGKDSWWGVKEERNEIFDFLDREQIGGVILLSADRHRTDVYQIARPNSYDLYEFETSKLTNDHTHPTKKEALFSYNEGTFFGLLRFDTTKPDPEVTFQCVTAEDEVVYELTLPRSQLQAE
ncbi:Alkaline phosphatase D precursor [Planctomycetes bacterium MalM25]|nr:Alkaline phosphatase D precursor [Planctomycetes bacterium MalM25]